MIELNIDAGEQEDDLQHDLKLLECADALNIALGGHAGIPQQSQELANRTIAVGKVVHLHPGYPDREHFGRRVMPISWQKLSDSLSWQREVLPEVTLCKFHGALYHEACSSEQLAGQLVDWSLQHGVTRLVTPDNSALARFAIRNGLSIKREGFADRRYRSVYGQLQLVPRSEPQSLLTEYDQLQQQVEQIVLEQQVTTNSGSIEPLRCDTLCLHGDHKEAISNARQLRHWLSHNQGFSNGRDQ